ncbi:MAG: restriction endonuclease subunit S [Verrucomicrobia bacterium]|nr:restriction endonuclease subunit S [Verrucomicrobiota bacterium]
MQATESRYINTIDFLNLYSWDVKAYLSQSSQFNPSYPFVYFGEFLSKPNIEKIKIDDEEEYKILGVRSYGKGVFANRTVKGKTLKMREYQKAKNNHLFWCKVDTKNGAFGVIKNDLADGVASSNMTFAEIDTNKINVDFLQLLFTSKGVMKYLDSFVTGTTNRKYIRPEQLLNEIKIPLPKLSEQQKIVSAYFKKVATAENLLQQASDLEGEIEKYFLEQLGLKPFSLKEKITSLQTTDYASLDRWDFFSTDTRIAIELRKSKFPLSSIGQSFRFAKRSFNKATYKQDTFKYIEIGAIDPTKGILEAKEVAIKKAPSRATQIVNEGDLIIGTTRPYLKKFAIVTEEYNNDVCSSGFCIIQPSKEYHLPYLHQFLKCTYGIEQLKNKMTGGLYPAITEPELKEIKIPFPDVDIQKEIMTLIELKKENILNNKSLIASIRIEAEQEFEKAIFNN